MSGRLTSKSLLVLLPLMVGGGLLLAAVVGYLLFFSGRPSGPLPEGSSPMATSLPKQQEAEAAATEEAVARGYQIVEVLPKDAIPAIFDPLLIPAAEADRLGWMLPEEQVLGLFLHGDARAYPINMLSSHEIVNDVVGGVPVAVTW